MSIVRKTAVTRNVVVIGIVATLAAFLMLKAFHAGAPINESRPGGLVSPSAESDYFYTDPIAMP